MSKLGPKTSPTLTVKRGANKFSGQWQDFISREQSSVDHLIQNSFATFCKEMRRRNLSSSSSSGKGDELTPSGSARTGYNNSSLRWPRTSLEAEFKGEDGRRGSTCRTLLSSSSSVSIGAPYSIMGTTLPRSSAHHLPRMGGKDGQQQPDLSAGMMLQGGSSLLTDRTEEHGRRSSISSQVLPGIRELEMLYAPMKNLSRPLPGQSHLRSPPPNSSSRVAALDALELRPLDWKLQPLTITEDHRRRDDDQESEICSVIADIPPPLAPVQSHALLEESLGHVIPPLPRTPARTQKFRGSSDWAKSPPLPPRRTSSKLSLLPSRPSHLNVDCIYANAKITGPVNRFVKDLQICPISFS